MLPIQITIKDVPNSHALEEDIRKKFQKLTQFHEHINSCRVVVDLEQKHKHQGKLFGVHIDMTVPGKEFAVTHKLNEDAYVAVRDAFDALKRQLENHTRRHHEKINIVMDE